MVRPYVSVIVGAPNWQESLPLTLIDLDRDLSRREYSYEIIVVCPQTAAGARKNLNRFGLFIDHLRYAYLDFAASERALKAAGNREARGTWRLFLGEGCAAPIALFDKAIPLIKECGEVVTLDRIRARDFSFGAWWVYLEQFVIDAVVRTYFNSRAKNFLAAEFRCFSESAANYVFQTAADDGPFAMIEEVLLAESAGYGVRSLRTVATKPRPRIAVKMYPALIATLRRLRARLGPVAKSYAPELKNL